MTEKEKMLAGQLYDCGDPALLKQWHKAKDLVREYNQTVSDDSVKKGQILKELLGGKGKIFGSHRLFMSTMERISILAIIAK
ncbi:maltose O-acetyltransferase [Faecalicoccus pleomorphus]|uniref:Maltose O-acetyltransferase n=1 Tax=Faecalicoccus pleomorphus TaxID=1323 RepID=A0A380LM53_9FIRM|nr:maltose acetyltransferase domain-containing protein [Faecalicoccus pleomorphus]SUO04343.1 maltose O-acetyltransferase [Faecalicoccus pleomorphus]